MRPNKTNPPKKIQVGGTFGADGRGAAFARGKASRSKASKQINTKQCIHIRHPSVCSPLTYRPTNQTQIHSFTTQNENEKNPHSTGRRRPDARRLGLPAAVGRGVVAGAAGVRDAATGAFPILLYLCMGVFRFAWMGGDAGRGMTGTAVTVQVPARRPFIHTQTNSQQHQNPNQSKTGGRA